MQGAENVGHRVLCKIKSCHRLYLTFISKNNLYLSKKRTSEKKRILLKKNKQTELRKKREYILKKKQNNTLFLVYQIKFLNNKRIWRLVFMMHWRTMFLGTTRNKNKDMTWMYSEYFRALCSQENRVTVQREQSSAVCKLRHKHPT